MFLLPNTQIWHKPKQLADVRCVLSLSDQISLIDLAKLDAEVPPKIPAAVYAGFVVGDSSVVEQRTQHKVEAEAVKSHSGVHGNPLVEGSSPSGGANSLRLLDCSAQRVLVLV